MGKKTNKTFFDADYTAEQVASIKENLKRAFDIDYIPVQIEVKDLYTKRHKKWNPQPGQKFYKHIAMDIESENIERGWHILTVTYTRSGVVFFTYDNRKKEQWGAIDSEWFETVIPATIDMEELAIPDKNIPLFKFERLESLPTKFKITVIKNDKTTFNI